MRKIYNIKKPESQIGAKITVHTPFPIDSLRGNSVSARRIAGLLREHTPNSVSLSDSGAKTGTDALIALHAGRSARCIQEFRESNPKGAVALLLTGSDLYDQIPSGNPDALGSIEDADVLIIAHDNPDNSLPGHLREKVLVVPKSLHGVTLPEPSRPHPQFQAVLSAHLRPLKDPLRSAIASRELPAESRLQIHHYGAAAAESAGLGDLAKTEHETNPRYFWHNEVTRSEALQATSEADLILNTSLVEGGANALCEALQLGKPIIATDIPANVGMLGSRHPGLFTPGNTTQLATLLEKAETNPKFYTDLEFHSRERASLFSVEAEIAGWRKVMKAIGAATG